MDKFAKLFESEKYGQILVVNDENEDGKPVITVSLMPAGLGVCSTKNIFESGEYEKCDKAFEGFNLDTAENIAKGIYSQLGIEEQSK